MLVGKEGKERIEKGREENTWKREIIGQWSRKRKLREKGWGIGGEKYKYLELKKNGKGKA